jgi:hypothetical protein
MVTITWLPEFAWQLHVSIERNARSFKILVLK